MKKILLILICLMVLITGFSCQTDGPDPKKPDPVETGKLKISVFLGGYGKAWIQTLASQFEAETGIEVSVETNSSLPDQIPTRLEVGVGDDIFFSHGIKWEVPAVKNQILDITDLYQQEVEDGVKLIDRIDPGLLSTARLGDRYFKLPWTKGAGGLVYNAKLFDQYGWQIPTTFAELMALCQQIYSEARPTPLDSKKTIKPFVWSQEIYYWDYLMFDWWAQLMGVEWFNDYVKLDSPALFNPSVNKFGVAFDYWSKLVAENPWFSMESSDSKPYMAAQMDFINGYAAMIPNAHWLESEMRDSINPNRCEMRLMPTPFIPGAKINGAGQPIPVNYSVGAGDSVIIPANAPNKLEAKKFLLFLARKSSCKTFTEKTNGTMLAMDYSGITFETGSITRFAQDIMQINMTAQKFNLYSNAPMFLGAKINPEWPIEGIQQYANYFAYYNNPQYFANPSLWLSSNPRLNGEDFTSAQYTTIVSRWNTWKNELGL